MRLYRNCFKRLFDLLLSLFGVIILLPVFLLTVLLLGVANKGSAFFTQRRPGKHGKIFKVIKFKTMNDHKDENGALLPDALRLTRIGRFVRKTSLDEIPQLLNVIKGDMSLIGPRPLLMEYLALYNQDQMRRHDVRPGITGWAQVHGRNAISWKDKFAYDIWYVDHLTFWLDVRIIFITILKVFKAEGISGRGVVTAEKFNGQN